ncbi:uncharacterized protein (DUF2252 family) [Silvimonas terrae]|uniref:Uncharacterized protein (DUF2252 family) n=1 Tax=Silvimonas terrae TaxID=300266 RepID=A0A840RGD1_9NEIS|nr:DUF2252 family protein [Silvimonas terrae]MBB5191480.1 uncharacterized protein (DUF2252 family) [Silvimonas terrae]
MKKLPRPDERRPLLLARRNLKMARSPHAYVRGNTVQFYQWLHSQRGHALPHGPAVWICGDCHIGNLGPLAGADGEVTIQIRDLDQTVIGNPAHDLVRLGLSLATAGRGSRLSGVVIARMLEEMVRGYEQSFSGKLHDPHHKPDAVRLVMREATARSWKELAKERIVDTDPIIPRSKHFWPLSREERKALRDLFAQPEVKQLATRLKSREDDAPVTLIDAAYWVKGCSSLGLLRYAVLLAVGTGKQREFCLMDVKQAIQAAAPRHAHARMPRDNSQRVREGALQLSPALGERLVAARFMDNGVFVRELLPQDLKLEIDTMETAEAMRVAHYLARIVGNAHARQMDEDTRRAWLTELGQRHGKTLDAPSWLWQSVVELVGSHEQGYLEHCRRYALTTR